MVKWWRNHLYSVESVQGKQWRVKTVSHKFIKRKVSVLWPGFPVLFMSFVYDRGLKEKELDMVKHKGRRKIQQYYNELTKLYSLKYSTQDETNRLSIEASHCLEDMCEWCLTPTPYKGIVGGDITRTLICGC